MTSLVVDNNVIRFEGFKFFEYAYTKVDKFLEKVLICKLYKKCKYLMLNVFIFFLTCVTTKMSYTYNFKETIFCSKSHSAKLKECNNISFWIFDISLKHKQGRNQHAIFVERYLISTLVVITRETEKWYTIWILPVINVRELYNCHI